MTALQATLQRRRDELRRLVAARPVLLWSGARQQRNIPAVQYRFRSSSHVVHLFGHLPPDAVALITEARARLFLAPRDELWEGAGPAPTLWAEERGFDEICSREELPAALREVRDPLTLPVPSVLREQETVLGRSVDAAGGDTALAQAMIACRLRQDEFALRELRCSAARCAEIHDLVPSLLRNGITEEQIAARLEYEGRRTGMELSFQPTVTLRGEILHDTPTNAACREGELLLVDFGVESPRGYASDMTRTWPIRSCSAVQQEFQGLVRHVQSVAIGCIRPGVRFRNVHLAACTALMEGLVGLGLVRGEPETLVNEGVSALFFPHGIGHLVGLDVHDMEDLGDKAGYPQGRERSTEASLRSLRLDRDLEAGMVVTIEPGFYCIPALLDRCTVEQRGVLNGRQLELVRSEIRGLRIEDEVLVTDQGCEILTRRAGAEAANGDD